MSWFEEWFDSPLYEKVYANRNREEAALLASLIESIIPKKVYPNVLDLGCGRGRHSIALAKIGYKVTGIDLSEEAILKARRLAEIENLTYIPQFLVGDMREPIRQSFNAVLNLFTTFGYFFEDSENILVLKNVNQMLHDGGYFIQDFLNPQYIRKTLVPFEEGQYDNLYYEIERFIDQEMVYKKIRFTGSDLDEPIEFSERVKLYTLDWFKEQLSNVGMEWIKVYGNYDGQPFSNTKSPRMIMVSKKEV